MMGRRRAPPWHTSIAVNGIITGIKINFGL
jgi:hypothetical protein